jgi:ketosteroid isomerase-like protein
MQSLETRIATLEARFALSELRSKYCWYTARGDRDAVVELFTPDGVFENHRKPGGVAAIATGHDEIRSYLSQMAPGRRLPSITNEVVHIEGDAAEGTCFMSSVGEDHFCGHYMDWFQRHNGKWLFNRRQFFPYWPVFAPSRHRLNP